MNAVVVVQDQLDEARRAAIAAPEAGSEELQATPQIPTGQPPPLAQVQREQQQRHRQRAYYLANVTMIDQKVGEILDALEEDETCEEYLISE